MRKAAHHLDGVDSLNLRRWRGKRLHHHGGGVCWLFVFSCCHELIVCKKWYKNNLKTRLSALLSNPPTGAPYHVLHPCPVVVLPAAGLPCAAHLTLSATCLSCIVPYPPILSCFLLPCLPRAVHHPPSLCYPTPTCHPSYLS